MKPDTHISQATPLGRGAISIIRLSGPDAAKSVSLICGEKKGSFIDRKPTLTTIYDTSGSLIDTALITYFKKPASYTGEDVIEISCHGNPFIVDSIIEALLKTGVRLSEPGEFTRDAFLNGKIDLVQAESIGNLISSRSMAASKMNLRILRGSLTKQLSKIRRSLIVLLSNYEFELDISEDDTFSLMPPKKARSIVDECIQDCEALLKTYNGGLLYNKGLRLVIIGKPNVGKSTLLNQLTGIDRAITSGVPGTTRDTIEALFSVRDIPITLVDTAGIGNPTDPIEKLGVKRSIDESKNCDMIINLFTPTDPPKKIHFGGIPTIRVINKVDTIDKHQKERLLKNTNNVVFISALFNTGLTTLKDEIYKKIKLSTPEIGDVVITTKRQKHLVVSGLKDLRQARSLLKNNPALVELLCVDIRSCVSSIDTLLGNTTEDDVLNNIFNNFCVGK